MVQPQYSNAFTVTYNPKLGEMIINFSQEYPVLSEQPNTVTTEMVQIRTESARKDVCGVVLPESVAHQLLDVIGNAFTSAAHQE